MHELSIAMEVIALAEREMKAQGGTELCELEIEVGALAGVDRKALQYSIELALMNSGHTTCRVRIHFVPAKARCNVCGAAFTPAGRFALCNACKSADITFVSGWELRLNSLEIA